MTRLYLCTTTRRLKLAALALTMGVSACAVPTQPFLDQARSGCTAGDQNACQQIAGLQAQVNAEQNDQAGKVALGFLTVLGAAAAGAAAGYAASRPVYVAPAPVVVVCPRWGCY